MEGTLATPVSDRAVPAGDDDFIGRHIGPSEADIASMLAFLGQPDLGALVDAIVPESIRLKAPLALAAPVAEPQALARLRALAAGNRIFRSYIGMGYQSARMPYVIERNVLQNPAWYTAYTPYQAEIAQGRLEGMLNFQTMVCDLTALPVANASLLDEATAAAEAMMMCRRASSSTSAGFFVSSRCHPQTIAVLQTRAQAAGIELRVGEEETAPDAGAFGILLQVPASTGEIAWQSVPQLQRLVDAAHAKHALVVVAADPMALVLLAPPGEWGADIVIGSAQRFGLPLGFGGPHAAFLACRDSLKRSLPGRVVGVSVDSQGGPALRLALQTREQHIRREKATSNICTSQALLAVLAGFYAAYHGPHGLQKIALRIHRFAVVLAAGLRSAGLRVGSSFFDTIAVAGVDAAAIHSAARARGINLRELGPDRVGVALDETVERSDVETLWSLFGLAPDSARFELLDAQTADAIPQGLRRASPILSHPVFNSYHSETAMLRYLRRLADRDLALDRTMIPLGSCTMKLNATAEMIPISWPQFADVHPYAPQDQVQGYRQLTDSLERWLAECSGYDAVSLQPNAGSQGELAGLLAIRAWHRTRGQSQRDICLIPESAHGTNPASAHLAGLQVVVVACDTAGNVDLDDLQAKASRHSERLAALMVTYPSTHGVFEEAIGPIGDIVHKHGGQVYVDGANLNALVGLAAPGRFGGDVSHLNLHKTFCIPHGGGGPGIGPVAVKAHLAPFLPGRPGVPSPVGPVSAAPYGSAGILPIVWMYVNMMGGRGLQRATEVALLSANYVARRLEPHYPILYAGRNGFVAHECIIDLRPLKDTSGVTAEDVAKRLMDYGLHAPTVSFPVAGTMMIEPTESEPKSELERFIDAMIAIRAEIHDIEQGRMDRVDNPLKNAPHTAPMIAADAWPHPYSRRVAAFPPGVDPRAKVWPAVARIDNVYGDRNLMCTCPPLSAYETVAAASAAG
ncbi:MAG: aminomethyl-transferring glycine dehydrogenase [Burkholderiaceae bacterium]|nr:aminomethyl-transferring glycine dehydrogenase [Burkholderiaceae bacterium]